MAKKKIIIVIAPNGNREDDPIRHVPVTPAEIAEDAFRCFKAGASVLHVHGRDAKTRRPTAELKVYSEIIERVRAKCNMLVETTTGVGPVIDPLTGKPKLDPVTGEPSLPSDEERLGLLNVKPEQEMFAVAAGSFNMYNPGGIPPVVYQNSPYYMKQNVQILSKRKVSSFQFETLDVSFLHNIQRLMDEGSLPRDSKKFWLNYCLGYGGLPPTARYLSWLAAEGERMFPENCWGTLAPGAEHFTIASLGAAMGCDIVRTGFEDVVTLPNGQPAKSNAELVEALVKIVQDVGREVATPDEARRILHLA